jgi:signal transduction histidine kinase
MKYTIKTKILIFFFVPIAVAMFVVLWSGFQLQQELLEEKQVLIFSGRSAQIEAYIGGIAFKTQQDILSFRRDYLTLPEYNNQAIFQIMDAYLGSNPDINGISISYINESTKSTDKLYQLQMHRNQDVLTKEVFSDEEIHYTKASYVAPVNIETIFTWTPAYRDELRGDSYLISCSYPILKDKQVDAVVTFDVRLDKINNFIGGIAKLSPGSIILMTEDQHVIFNSGNTNIIATPENQRIIKAKVLDSLSSIKMTQQISEEKKTGDFSPKRLYLKRYDGVDILVISRFVKEYRWRIFYAITAKHIYQLALKELYPALLLSIGILILLFFILTYITNKITRPIVKLNLAMKGFSETGSKIDVTTNLTDEIGELSRAFTQMQDTIIQRNKDLEKLDVAKSNFLSLISHEIRTPLNGILGSAFFLKEQNEDSEMAEFIDMLTESAERLESLSKKALLITELQSRSGDGKHKIIVSVREMVMESIKEFVEIIEKKQLQTEVIIDENAKVEVFADAFATAVNELMSNSCRFANKNTTVRIIYKEENGSKELQFWNDGPMIDPVRLEQLGKPFELGEAHYDKHTGLGLAVVNTIMEMHGGKMSIKNNGGQGVIARIIF